MAQIIKHRRGTAQQLKTVTLQKAELGVSTGSVAGLTTPILHVGDGANAAGHVVGRLFQGSTQPTLNSGDIGSAYNDLLFHDSATFKLVKLHSSGNETLNLANNLANQAITGSLTVSSTLKVEGASTATSISASGEITASNILATGNIHAVGDITFDGGSSGTITLGSGADDNIVISGDVNSHIIPNTDDTFDLGSADQQWRNLYVDGTGYIDQLEIDGMTNTGNLDVIGELHAQGVLQASSSILLEDATAAITHEGATGLAITSTNGYVDIESVRFTGAGLSGATITASDITVGTGKTLDVSGGTLTLANDQISGNAINGGTIGSITIAQLAGAMDANSQAITNINIDSGAIDGVTLGASSAITAATIDNVKIDGATIGHTSDTDLLTLASGKLTVSGETETTTLDVDGVANISGNITLDGGGAQTITHTAGSGNLTIASTNGNTLIEGSTFSGNDLTVPGDLTVTGTTTTINSTTVEIGDNIIVLNSAGAAADGGIQVIDTTGTAHTGSMLWNGTNDYWYSGVSGSTHYRIPQQAAGGNLTDNKILISDANGRIESSANITDNGTTVDFNDVDLTSVDMIQGVDANTHIDLGTSDTIEVKGNVLPNTTNADDLGSDTKRFKDLYLEGNADIDGTANIEGVLTTQATIAATAGITVTNTAATVSSDLVLNYDTNSVDRVMLHDGGNNSVDFAPAPASTSTNGDNAGEYLRWNGSAFEMSQTIDGGSF